MRTYRLEIRLIQAATVLAFIVLIAGFFGLWGQGGNQWGGQLSRDRHRNQLKP